MKEDSEQALVDGLLLEEDVEAYRHAVRFVVSAGDLDALPRGSIIMNPSGRPYRCVFDDVKFRWSYGGNGYLPSSYLAQGQPYMVLWNPECPTMMFDAWQECQDVLTPFMEKSAADVIRSEKKKQLWNHYANGGYDSTTDEEEMNALAGNDFVICWGKS